jgi:hypothetical protein
VGLACSRRRPTRIAKKDMWRLEDVWHSGGRIERAASKSHRVLGISLGGFPLHIGASNLAILSASLPATFEDSGVLYPTCATEAALNNPLRRLCTCLHFWEKKNTF